MVISSRGRGGARGRGGRGEGRRGGGGVEWRGADGVLVSASDPRRGMIMEREREQREREMMGMMWGEMEKELEYWRETAGELYRKWERVAREADQVSIENATLFTQYREVCQQYSLLLRKTDQLMLMKVCERKRGRGRD